MDTSEARAKSIDGNSREQSSLGKIAIEHLGITIDLPDLVESPGKISTTQSIQNRKNHLSKFIFNKSKHYRHSLILIGCLFVVFISTFLSYIYFGSHALPKSRLGNQDVSFWSRQRIEAFVQQKSTNYSISINDSKGINKINLKDIGIEINSSKTVDNFFSYQNKSVLNRLNVFSSKYHAFKAQEDNLKLVKFFDSQESTLKTAGQDAKILIEKGDVVIIPEVKQEEVKFKDPVEKIRKSMSSAEPIVIEMERVVTDPNITSSKLTALRDHMQGIINTNLVLKMNGIDINTTKDQRASWLTFDSHSADKASVSVDLVKLEGFVDGAIRPYVKPPRSRVVVANSDGTTKELVGGENGVSVTEMPKVLSEISLALNNKTNATIKVPVSYTEKSTITAADYPKWIQVDLTNKRMYAYERGTLVNSFLISAGAPETPTVVGQFSINYKVRKQTMRGLNADGSRYVQPDVEWVNYFYQDYAIHGNYWRPASVFGNVNTSHGCVGLVNSEAEWIYNWAPSGTPIITHY